MGEFTGFGEATTAFLGDLAANNDREWFQANRDRYEAHWLEPAVAFVEAAAEALREIAPGVDPQPRVNGSIMRINRDVRFSADKRPYKDHLDIGIWEGAAKKTAASMFYVRITADTVGIATGAHGFDRARLAAYRDAVADRSSGEALETAVAEVEGAGWPVAGEHYKRTPAGFEVPSSRESLLRHNALWVAREGPPPPELGTPAFVGHCMASWRETLPLHRWLVAHLQD